MVENKNYAHVMVSRFFLGVFESSVTPGLSLMTGFWYTRDEIPLRQTIWYSAIGWGGMIGALMAAGIQGSVTRFRAPWQSNAETRAETRIFDS